MWFLTGAMRTSDFVGKVFILHFIPLPLSKIWPMGHLRPPSFWWEGRIARIFPALGGVVYLRGSLKGAVEGGESLLNIFICVGQGEKARFKLGRGDIDPPFEEGPEVASEGINIALFG